jgi:hypothetical protein
VTYLDGLPPIERPAPVRSWRPIIAARLRVGHEIRGDEQWPDHRITELRRQHNRVEYWAESTSGAGSPRVHAWYDYAAVVVIYDPARRADLPAL